MDDSVTGGAGAGTGGGSDASTTPAPTTPDPTTAAPATPEKSDQGESYEHYPGLDAATIFGLDFTHTTGFVMDTTIGSEYFIQINPLVLATGTLPAFAALLPSELTFNIGANVEILFGREISIHCGYEEIKLNLDRTKKLSWGFAVLIGALAAAYPLAAALIPKWKEKDETILVGVYEGAMQLSLAVFTACSVRAAHAEEISTAELFELLIKDHMGTDTP